MIEKLDELVRVANENNLMLRAIVTYLSELSSPKKQDAQDLKDLVSNLVSNLYSNNFQRGTI